VGHVVGLTGMSFSPKRENDLTQKTAKVAQAKEIRYNFSKTPISYQIK